MTDSMRSDDGAEASRAEVAAATRLFIASSRNVPVRLITGGAIAVAALPFMAFWIPAAWWCLIGLMAALELIVPAGGNTQIAADHPIPRAVQQGCLQRGVIVRNQLGTIEVSPPLNVSRSEVDLMLNALEESFIEAIANN